MFVITTNGFVLPVFFTMPKKGSPPRPTDAELSVLCALWQLSPSTVRHVQKALGGDEATVYTTVLKTLQIMTEKGLVDRDELARTHVYRPRLSEQGTQRQLVHDLLRHAFGGSVQTLVVQVLPAERATPEELREIRRLLNEMGCKEREGRAPPSCNRPSRHASARPCCTSSGKARSWPSCSSSQPSPGEPDAHGHS